MKKLYSVWDAKAKAYGPIMSYPHDAVATREFVRLVCDAETTLHRYPQDFALHSLGELFDSLDHDEVEEGEPVLMAYHPPRVVVTAEAVKAMQQQPVVGVSEKL